MKSILKDTRKPDIIFDTRTGQINICEYLSSLLGLRDGDVIDILEDNGEYYIAVKFIQPIGRHEATCHCANKSGSYLRCYSKKLTQKMADICNVATEKFSLFVGEQKEQLGYGTIVPLITKNVIL